MSDDVIDHPATRPDAATISIGDYLAQLSPAQRAEFRRELVNDHAPPIQTALKRAALLGALAAASVFFRGAPDGVEQALWNAGDVLVTFVMARMIEGGYDQLKKG